MVLYGCSNPLSPGQVSTTQFTPPGGVYNSPQLVTITTTTAGASIHYTTDGTTPTGTLGTLYAGPVSVGVSQTIKAVAYRTGWLDSMATATYTILNTIQPPTFSPPAGTYTSAQNVTISTITRGAFLRYTTDGTTPTSKVGTFYTGPVSVGMNQTINAIAFGAGQPNGRSDSAVSSATYNFQVAVPTFSPAAGTYTSAQSVTISTTTPGAAIRYTTDGSMPTNTAGTPYTVPVSVSTSKTIRAIAYKTGWPDSAVATAGYVITVVTTLAGTAGLSGSADGMGSAALFRGPGGVTTDGTNLYVADSGNNTIRKIVITTGAVTTLAGTAGSSGSTDGTGNAALFSGPGGITTDGTNLYVADSGNNTIRKIVISTGTVTTLAGTAGLSGSTDGMGSAARFSGPGGITSDGTSLYVADSGSSTIRKIVISTGTVTTLAGTAGLSGSTDGTGSAALFNHPTGITTDGANLSVADSGNCTIRNIVISTGIVTTLAGTAGLSGSADGTGNAALFSNPGGIATDGTSLYVADTNNNTIRKIAMSTGAVTTLAGTAGFSGSTDGTASTAQFDRPGGITTDGTNLYVADSGNSTIRMVR